MPESTLDPNGIMPSSAWEAAAHTPSPVVRTQPTQSVPVAKMLAPSMPKTIGCGFAGVRPHWMTVRDNPTIPSQPPASSGTPCVPQFDAIGSLSSKPSPFAPQLMETHVFQLSPSGFSLEYKGTLPGHVETHDVDDDDVEELCASALQTLEEIVPPMPASVQTTPNLSWRNAVMCSRHVCLTIG